MYTEPYYSGGTLDVHLSDEGPLTEPVAREILIGLLEGVDALWSQKRLVHRDIKPANIALHDGEPVLLDLGIALHSDRTRLTAPDAPSPKTPAYAAPEQFVPRRLARIDFRTDLFSVGIVSFEAVTGVHPFVIPGEPTGLYDRLTSGADMAELEGRGLSAGFCNVVERLLAPTPNRRYRRIEFAKRDLGMVG